MEGMLDPGANPGLGTLRGSAGQAGHRWYRIDQVFEDNRVKAAVTFKAAAGPGRR